MNPKSIVITTPVNLESGAAQTAPVAPRWVLGGEPVTRTWSVLRSHDLTSDLVVWECTAGRFECRYSVDEVVMIVGGEVFITDESGDERRLGPGDLGFFRRQFMYLARSQSRQKNSSSPRNHVASGRNRIENLEKVAADRKRVHTASGSSLIAAPRTRQSAAPVIQTSKLAAVLAALPVFLLAVLTLLVLSTSPLLMVAAFALFLLLLLAFFRGLGAHAVLLGLIGVFVCHSVLLL